MEPPFRNRPEPGRALESPFQYDAPRAAPGDRSPRMRPGPAGPVSSTPSRCLNRAAPRGDRSSSPFAAEVFGSCRRAARETAEMATMSSSHRIIHFLAMVELFAAHYVDTI
ncbi:MAG: hypothetical protein INR65_05045 [Gluconacetobacter diazotrophicus]|nr:hypothetical protein [Gluconacetobacter diazotrophicus]